MAEKIAKFNLFGTIGDDGWSWDFVTEKMLADWIDQNQDADTFEIHINSNGGLLQTGFTMYDLLKNSGKKIVTVAVGMVYSAATMPYLAADKENRKCYENADFGIHFPMIDPWGLNMLNSDTLTELAESLEKDNQKILDLYTKNTGVEESVLTEMMKKEETFGSAKAKELGFVGEIMLETTNFIKYKAVASFGNKTNNLNMANLFDKFNEKMDALGTKFQTVLDKMNIQIKNMMITCPDGTEINVEKESGEIAVGDKATPDGTFVLENGKTVTIADGVVTEITEPVDELTQVKNELDAVKAERDTLKTEIAGLKESQEAINQLATETKELFNELKQAKATFNPTQRQIVIKTENIEDKKAQIDTLKENYKNKK